LGGVDKKLFAGQGSKSRTFDPLVIADNPEAGSRREDRQWHENPSTAVS